MLGAAQGDSPPGAGEGHDKWGQSPVEILQYKRKGIGVVQK